MTDGKTPGFDGAAISAIAHLYRGELYRSTVWRTRLDATTNWAVVTTGLALSLTFSSEAASPLPLVLVGLLVAVFLYIEGRRYRYFDFWRIRAHILEVHFFGPILRGEGVRVDSGWNQTLYQDYRAPALHAAVVAAADDRVPMHEDRADRDAALGEAALGLFDGRAHEGVRHSLRRARRARTSTPSPRS